MTKARRRCGYVAAGLWLTIVGCGGSGGGSGDGSGPSLTVTGTVRAPDAPIPDGTVVRLQRIDGGGGVVTEISAAATTSGHFTLDLGSARLGGDLVVAVRDGDARLRAFAASTEVEVDATSEAIVRLVLDRGAGDVSRFTAHELTDLRGGVDLATAVGRTADMGSVNEVAGAVQATVAADAALQAFLTKAAEIGQTADGVGDIGNLFPDAEGSLRRFAGTDAMYQLDFVNDVVVEGAGVVDRTPVTVVAESHGGMVAGPADFFVAKDSHAVTNHGNTDVLDVLTPQLVPYPLASFPLAPGSEQVLTDRTRVPWQDIDGDERLDRGDVVATLRILGTDDVDVPVGRFPDALRVETEVNANVRLSHDGSTVPVRTRTTQWLVPNLGAVKRVIERESLGMVLGARREDLLGFDVDGVRRGFQPVQQLMSGVAKRGELDRNDPFAPAVGSDGHGYLVVSCRELPTGETGLYGVMVSPSDGRVSEPFKVARHDCVLPFASVPIAAVVSNGDGYLVVFVRFDDETGTYAVRVSSSGEPLDDESGIRLLDESVSFGVASNGTGYLMVWPESVNGLHGVAGLVLAADGTMQPVRSLFTSDDPIYRAAVASDGTDYLVTWRAAFTGPWKVYGGRVRADGEPLDAREGFPIATGERIRSSMAPQVSFDGVNYLVTWQDFVDAGPFDGDTALFGRRIGRDGTLRDGDASSDGLLLNDSLGPKEAYGVAFSGVHHTLVWLNTGSRSRFGIPIGLFSTRVDPSGAAVDQPVSSFGVPSVDPPTGFGNGFLFFRSPALASGPDGALLVWVRAGIPSYLEASLVAAY